MERLDVVEEGGTTIGVEGRRIVLPGSLRDAWLHARWVLVLVRIGAAQYVLAYDRASATEVHRLAAPEGWELDRLSRDVHGGPVVIAWSPTAIHGHNDWQFTIDLSEGRLERFAPSR